MPEEPNKKMDEILRNYAEERRKGPEVTLHPATRQMLQGEVTRVFGNATTDRPWWKRLRAFWPQIGFAGGLCAIFAVAVLSLRQPSGTSESVTSRNTSEPTESKDFAPVPTQETLDAEKQSAAGVSLNDNTEEDKLAVPVKEEKPASDGKSNLYRERETSNSKRAPTKLYDSPKEQSEVRLEEARQQLGRPQSAVQIIPTPEETETVLRKNDVLSTAPPRLSSVPTQPEPLKGESLERASARTLATSAPRPASANRSAALTNLGAARRLNFVQVPNPRDAKVTVARRGVQPILNNFQVEQTGTNVRVYDEDGSVYLGALQVTNSAVGAVVELGLELAREPILANSTAYFFSVQGTNQTLRSDVVLTGRYFARTNFQPTSLDSFAIAPEAKAKEQAPPLGLIVGNATVGGTNQVPVHAVSSQP